MLTRTLDINYEGFFAASTPLLIPSFSSRTANAYYPLKNTIEILSPTITDVSLVSAYDIFYLKEEFPNIDCQNLLFIDSGGYECNINNSLSDTGLYNASPNHWNDSLYSIAIDNCAFPVPMVLVSYDHPEEERSIADQISYAKDLFFERDIFLKELLLKSSDKNFPINIEEISQNIESLQEFDILGITEKELGDTVLSRMKNIVLIRQELETNGFEIPIHIFGSLDPITSPLYYFSGADIFDGLSWLRYVFANGETHYINSKGIEEKGIEMDHNMIWLECCRDNYFYLKEVEKNLIQVHESQDIGVFGYKADFFKDSYEKLNDEVGGIL